LHEGIRVPPEIILKTFGGACRAGARSMTCAGVVTEGLLLSDHIGSSSVTTDANGVKTASALYKAFGETRFSAGNLGTDYKFTGQREEASLGIYYFNARWMDPSLGRFTSPDSIVPTSTQGTQAWDRYAFVNNNPVRYTDPTGHVAETDVDQSQNNGQCDPAVTDCDASTNKPPSIEEVGLAMEKIGTAIMAVGAIVAVFSLIPVIGEVALTAGLIIGAIGGAVTLIGLGLEYIPPLFESQPTSTTPGPNPPFIPSIGPLSPWPTLQPAIGPLPPPITPMPIPTLGMPPIP
jgi:RHS repeat-associated protein